MSRLEFIKRLQLKPKVDSYIKTGINFKRGENTVIGGEGFGYEQDENGDLIHFPHFCGVIIGNDVSVGSNTCIDRGNISETRIGNGVKIDNLVHIAHNVVIGNNTLIVAGSVICGSVNIGSGCFIGANVTIKDHVTIGNNSYIGMGSVVTKNIGDNEMWYGNPAKFAKRC